MAVHAAFGATKRGMQNALQVDVLPAPIKGIDARLNLASNDPLNCVYAINLVPAEYGMQTRLGWRNWVEDLEFVPGNSVGVRSLVPFESATGSLRSKLFAVTNEGFYDVTVGTQGFAYVFPIKTGNAGWGNYVNYTDLADNEWVFFCDEENGLWEYDPVLERWDPNTSIFGQFIDGNGDPQVDPSFSSSNIVFVVEHKNRLWFVERDTKNGWYLEPGAKSGPATKFRFGSKFKHGGDLVGLYNWTIDSGSGIDDLLVSVGRGGDVIPYEGSDPADASTWGSRGTFYVGQIPQGRSIGSEYGGDLRLLCNAGVVSMSDLLSGGVETKDENPTNTKIAAFIRSDLNSTIGQFGWALKQDTNEGTLIVVTPPINGNYKQYVLNITVEGWGTWANVPGLTFEPWQGKMMVGTADSDVLRMDVTKDNITGTNPLGDPVSWSMLQNFVNGQSPGIFKTGKFIRPNFISTSPIAVNTKFVYDFNIRPICEQPAYGLPTIDGTWDVGIWDNAIWGNTAAPTGISPIQGSGSGRGRVAAVAMCGQSITRVTLASTDVMWVPMGPLSFS